MNKKIDKIKQQIKKECQRSKTVPTWFFERHLCGVETFARKLLNRLPNANKEVVLLSVWLHDLQRIRGKKGDHATVGALEAGKVLRKYDYDADTIQAIKSVIRSHSCNSNIMPKTVEEKILASADAMSHYANDFYLSIAALGQRNIEEYKKWALEKLDRDFNKKIQFAFARKLIRKRHEIIKKFITLG